MIKPALVDTDILSMFFRNNDNVVLHFKEYFKKYEKINISILTYYEIMSGLKHKKALMQLDSFSEFNKYNEIVPLTKDSVMISSDIYANLRKAGTIIDDIDILIAGIALSNNLVLVTHNKEHFKRIKELKIIDWSMKKNEENSTNIRGRSG